MRGKPQRTYAHPLKKMARHKLMPKRKITKRTHAKEPKTVEELDAMAEPVLGDLPI